MSGSVPLGRCPAKAPRRRVWGFGGGLADVRQRRVLGGHPSPCLFGGVGLRHAVAAELPQRLILEQGRFGPAALTSQAFGQFDLGFIHGKRSLPSLTVSWCNYRVEFCTRYPSIRTDQAEAMGSVSGGRGGPGVIPAFFGLLVHVVWVVGRPVLCLGAFLRPLVGLSSLVRS